MVCDKPESDVINTAHITATLDRARDKMHVVVEGALVEELLGFNVVIQFEQNKAFLVTMLSEVAVQGRYTISNGTVTSYTVA